MHYREQPGSEIGAGLPEVLLIKRAAQRVLHQIVRSVAVAGERPCIASQSRDLLFDGSMKFRHCSFLANLTQTFDERELTEML
jgi:hypothetical protein